MGEQKHTSALALPTEFGLLVAVLLTHCQHFAELTGISISSDKKNFKQLFMLPQTDNFSKVIRHMTQSCTLIPALQLLCMTDLELVNVTFLRATL